MISLVDKGSFQPIDDKFLIRSLDVFQDLSKVQDEYGKYDTDTFMNEVHDAIAAKYLHFTHINVEKHGFDARRVNKASGAYEYLEVKTASFDAQSWQATFNDTNLEKACLFKEDNVYLALAVWRGAANLLFVIYGSNRELGVFLENKVRTFLTKHTSVRSTQSVSMAKLVNEFGFKIFAVGKTCEEVYNLIHLKNRSIQRSSIYSIDSLAEKDGQSNACQEERKVFNIFNEDAEKCSNERASQSNYFEKDIYEKLSLNVGIRSMTSDKYIKDLSHNVANQLTNSKVDSITNKESIVRNTLRANNFPLGYMNTAVSCVMEATNPSRTPDGYAAKISNGNIINIVS